MRRACASALAVATLLALAGPARSEVIINVPFVRLSFGRPASPGSPGVHIRVPFVEVHTGGAAPTVPPPVVEVPPPPPLVPEPAAVPPRLMTHEEFAKTFQPAPGKYEVVLRHPRSGAPVTVSFTLPEGEPRIRVTAHGLQFDYGRRHEVDVRFGLGNRVRVHYHE